jgi:hypothetical protein
MKKRLLFLLLFVQTGLFATTHSVTSLGDSGAGSIRDLIAAANSGDTIDFLVAGTITLTSGEIAIDSDLVILSTGPANLTLSGNSANRIFNITAGNIHLIALSFENGVTTSGSGGAILNSSADTVTINNCVFNSCIANFDGGAILTDGAYLTILNSTFTNNHSSFDGGGIRINSGVVNIMSSTFNGNTSGFSGAGLRLVGGTCTIINSTISGNTASSNGGGLEGDFNLINCTITANSANNGGGAKPAGSTFQNCIIYNNSATGVGPDLDGSINSNGNNLIGNSSGSGGFAASDIIGADPLLDVLGFNGGHTATHALMSSSPCIDAGACRFAPSVDQRDVIRTGFPDIGAYEFGGTPFVINQISQQICSGDSLLFGSQTLDTAGVFTEIFESMDGCDSTVEMTLSLITVYHEISSMTICSGDSIVFGTQTLDSTGVYTEVFTSVLNCDSTVELTLTVFSPDMSVTQSGKTLEASGTADSYQWIDCMNNQPILNDTNQTFTALANGQYAVIIMENGCTDTSACYNVTTVNINERNIENVVSVFPTSVTDNVNLIFKHNMAQVSIRILNVLGREMYNVNHTNLKNLSLDLQKYEAGNYFIHLSTDTGTSIHRIIKVN